MAEQWLTIAARRQAVEAIEALERELVSLATWLTSLDQDRAACFLEEAAAATGAGGWELDRPLRAARRAAPDDDRPAAGVA